MLTCENETVAFASNAAIRSVFVLVFVHVVATAIVVFLPFRFSNALGLFSLGEINVFHALAMRPIYVAPLVLGGGVVRLLSDSEDLGRVFSALP